MSWSLTTSLARPENVAPAAGKRPDFRRRFTVIFAPLIVIWFLQNFDLQLRLTADPQADLARTVGDIAPLFGPLGFADWRISTAPHHRLWQRRA